MQHDLAQNSVAPTGERYERSFTAEPLAVRDAVRSAVARFARRLTEAEAGTLELALAEILNNVAEHGYADLPPGRVELSLRRVPGWLDCSVRDYGHPMPGLILPSGTAPAYDGSSADLPEGGWGWMLLRNLVVNLMYERQRGENRLSFQIPLSSETLRCAAKLPQ